MQYDFFQVRHQLSSKHDIILVHISYQINFCEDITQSQADMASILESVTSIPPRHRNSHTYITLLSTFRSHLTLMPNKRISTIKHVQNEWAPDKRLAYNKDICRNMSFNQRGYRWNSNGSLRIHAWYRIECGHMRGGEDIHTRTEHLLHSWSLLMPSESEY